jgi:tetratricopeptide (TPR) repeat protein
LLGSALRRQSRHAESEAQVREALALIRVLVRDFPDQPFYRDSLAHQCGYVAFMAQEHDQFREAAALHREGLAVARALLAQHPGRTQQPFYERNVVFNLDGLGTLYLRQGRTAEAVKASREAMAVAIELAQRVPHDPSLSFDVVVYQGRVADLIRTQGRLAEAEELYRQSLPRAERLARDHPNVLGYRSYVPRVWIVLAELHHAAGRAEEAEKAYRRGLELYEGVAKRFPDDAEAHAALAGCLCSCAIERLREPARALVHARRATTLLPAEPTYWLFLGLAHYRLGQGEACLAALDRCKGKPIHNSQADLIRALALYY